MEVTTSAGRPFEAGDAAAGAADALSGSMVASTTAAAISLVFAFTANSPVVAFERLCPIWPSARLARPLGDFEAVPVGVRDSEHLHSVGGIVLDFARSIAGGLQPASEGLRIGNRQDDLVLTLARPKRLFHAVAALVLSV